MTLQLQHIKSQGEYFFHYYLCNYRPRYSGVDLKPIQADIQLTEKLNNGARFLYIHPGSFDYYH
ncbi:MAG: hypothetical protein O2887_17730 [Bacteroidetes bacterium]|nr:hypothetical protein [Bacteroidota bacterium]